MAGGFCMDTWVTIGKSQFEKSRKYILKMGKASPLGLSGLASFSRLLFCFDQKGFSAGGYPGVQIHVKGQKLFRFHLEVAGSHMFKEVSQVDHPCLQW